MGDVVIAPRDGRTKTMHDELARQSLFGAAFEHGGYVAGGFARHVMMHQEGIGFRRAIDDYLHQRGSDIDLFFRDRSGYVAAFSSLADVDDSHMVRTKQMATGNAVNVQMTLVVDGSEKVVNVQLIKCSFGPPADIISEFDFTNCRFAFDGESSYYDVDAPALESASVLDIARLSPGSLPWRLMKYVGVHRYKRFTETTYHALIGHIMAHQDDKKTMGMALRLIRAKMFRPDDVLLLSALFDEERRTVLEAELNISEATTYEFNSGL